MTIVAMKPYIQSEVLVLPKRPFLKRIPPMKPIIPAANICHGVQGPCPNIRFETSILTAPTRNPDSPPNATPEIITIATTGLN